MVAQLLPAPVLGTGSAERAGDGRAFPDAAAGAVPAAHHGPAVPGAGRGCLDSHKAFVVKYSLHEDLDLSSHYDNAEVTLNVSLGKEFTEGNLYFGDFNQVLSTAHSCLPPQPPSFQASAAL